MASEAIPWDRAAHLHLELGERHFDAFRPSAPEHITELLAHLDAVERIPIHSSLAGLIGRVRHLIQSNREFLENPGASPPLSFPEELHEHSGKRLHVRHTAPQLPQNILAACHYFPLVADKPLFVLTSDNHAATSWMLSQLHETGEWDFDGTAMLSFDHHLDMVPVTDAAGPRKESVWSYLLLRSLVRRVGVVGVSPSMRTTGQLDAYRPEVDTIFGDKLYDGDFPSIDKFSAAFADLLQYWGSRGIRAVYPSIDLDGLAVDREGLTATDYNPITGLHWLLSNEFKGFMGHAHRCLPEIEREITDWTGYHGGQYFGVPSSWISRALQMVRNRGFRIGLRNHRTGQILAGDVMEYCGHDFEGRTAKVACNLVGELLRSCTI